MNFNCQHFTFNCLHHIVQFWIYKRLLLILSGITFISATFAQSTYKFSHLTTEDGLSQSSVTCILKDKQGFMWFGTRDGLNKYDSYDFQIFRNTANDSTSISNNTISSLFEDHQGIIWIGTEGGGLNYYDPDKGYFGHYLHNPEDQHSLTHNTVSCITEDEDHVLWLGTNGGGLSSFDRKSETFVNYVVDSTKKDWIESNLILSMIKDEDGILWMATEGAGLIRFNPKSKDFKHYKHDPDDPESISTDLVSFVFEDSHSNIWIGSWGFGINYLNKVTGKFTRYATLPDNQYHLPSDNVFTIAEDQYGIMWFGTRNGLSYFDPKKETFSTLVHTQGNEFSLTNDVVFSLYFDPEDKLMWTGTWGNGINLMDQLGRNTEHFEQNAENKNSLNDNDVFAFYEDSNGILWIGTEGGGLSRYDPVDNTFKAYVNNPKDPGSINNNNVMCIYQDKNNLLWIGTFGGGINIFDPKTETFTTLAEYKNFPLENRTILSFFEDSQGYLWMTTSFEGIIRLNPETGKYKLFQDDPNDHESQLFNNVLTITEDHAGAIWIGTRNTGLSRLDPETEEFTHFRHDPHNPESLGANGIYSLYEDQQNNLWIGTRGAGINVLKIPLGDKPVFRKITSKDGLVNDWILGIKADDHGNIWASGEGISRISPNGEHIQSYFFTAANQGAFYKSPRTGNFYLGSAGFDIFHPDSIPEKITDPPIYISQMSRFNTKENAGTAIPVPGILNKDSITLSFRDQILAFEFLTLSYDLERERKYAYLVENFNDEWIFIGKERKITFTGLSPGEYLLRVKSLRPNGQLSDKEATLFLNILPPWWQTRWASIFYMILGLSGLYGFYYWRTLDQRKKIKQKEKELEQERHLNDRLQQIDKLKDQFLANTSHELRTPLQGIIGLSETLFDKEPEISKKQDLSLIISSGKRLSNLVNSIMDFSKLKSHDLQIHLKPVDLRSIADVVLKIVQPLIKGKDILLQGEIPENLPLAFGDEDRIHQIMHNLIGNAIKFTEKGYVKILGSATEKQISITVKDSGIGIPKDKQSDIFKSFEQVEGSITRQYLGTGLGLSISKQLVELMGGTISVMSTVGEGSSFTFTLPVSEDQSVTKAVDAPTIRDNDDTFDLLESTITSSKKTKNSQFSILVVDDELINQQVLKNILSAENYSIDIAHNGEEGLEKISNPHSYDLVLLDIMMPKMSGFEVCQKIREKYLSTELPIIMITAKTQMDDLVHGFNLGANDYITKPFSKDELLSRVRTHLNLYQINKSNSKFIPIEFLKSIGKESILDVKLGDQSLIEVTVMFTDIRSYTTISESMSPNENFNFLNKYLSLITPLIRKHKGFVHQFLGDGIMAIFIDSPSDAINASIEMQKIIENFNIKIDKEHNIKISIGIGLHTGQLMMGIVGDQDRMGASVVADTVNTASRMEGLTKYFGAPIIFSETVFEGIENKNLVNSRFLGKVKGKGKTKPLKIYEALDGNEEDIAIRKNNSKEYFDIGIREYFNKSFATASVNFEKALSINTDDPTTRLYLKNAARFMVEGVEDNWDGIENIENK